MVKVFAHTRGFGQPAGQGENDYQEFSRMPAVGEYFTKESTGPWYRVVVVIHTPFEGDELAGEVYAVEVDHNAVLRRWSDDDGTSA